MDVGAHEKMHTWVRSIPTVGTERDQQEMGSEVIGRLRFALLRSRTSSREAVFQPQGMLCGIRPAGDRGSASALGGGVCVPGVK